MSCIIDCCTWCAWWCFEYGDEEEIQPLLVRDIAPTPPQPIPHMVDAQVQTVSQKNLRRHIRIEDFTPQEKAYVESMLRSSKLVTPGATYQLALIQLEPSQPPQ